MTAPRRVSDLTVDELEELVARAVENGVRRARERPAAATKPPAVPTAEEIEKTRAELRRRGLLSPPGRRR